MRKDLGESTTLVSCLDEQTPFVLVGLFPWQSLIDCYTSGRDRFTKAHIQRTLFCLALNVRMPVLGQCSQ